MIGQIAALLHKNALQECTLRFVLSPYMTCLESRPSNGLSVELLLSRICCGCCGNYVICMLLQSIEYEIHVFSSTLMGSFAIYSTKIQYPW